MDISPKAASEDGPSHNCCNGSVIGKDRSCYVGTDMALALGCRSSLSYRLLEHMRLRLHAADESGVSRSEAMLDDITVNIAKNKDIFPGRLTCTLNQYLERRCGANWGSLLCMVRRLTWAVERRNGPDQLQALLMLSQYIYHRSRYSITVFVPEDRPRRAIEALLLYFRYSWDGVKGPNTGTLADSVAFMVAGVFFDNFVAEKYYPQFIKVCKDAFSVTGDIDTLSEAARLLLRFEREEFIPCIDEALLMALAKLQSFDAALQAGLMHFTASLFVHFDPSTKQSIRRVIPTSLSPDSSSVFLSEFCLQYAMFADSSSKDQVDLSSDYFTHELGRVMNTFASFSLPPQPLVDVVVDPDFRAFIKAVHFVAFKCWKSSKLRSQLQQLRFIEFIFASLAIKFTLNVNNHMECGLVVRVIASCVESLFPLIPASDPASKLFGNTQRATEPSSSPITFDICSSYFSPVKSEIFRLCRVKTDHRLCWMRLAAKCLLLDIGNITDADIVFLIDVLAAEHPVYGLAVIQGLSDAKLKKFIELGGYDLLFVKPLPTLTKRNLTRIGNEEKEWLKRLGNEPTVNSDDIYTEIVLKCWKAMQFKLYSVAEPIKVDNEYTVITCQKRSNYPKELIQATLSRFGPLFFAACPKYRPHYSIGDIIGGLEDSLVPVKFELIPSQLTPYLPSSCEMTLFGSVKSLILGKHKSAHACHMLDNRRSADHSNDSGDGCSRVLLSSLQDLPENVSDSYAIRVCGNVIELDTPIILVAIWKTVWSEECSQRTIDLTIPFSKFPKSGSNHCLVIELVQRPEANHRMPKLTFSLSSPNEPDQSRLFSLVSDWKDRAPKGGTLGTNQELSETLMSYSRHPLYVLSGGLPLYLLKLVSEFPGLFSLESRHSLLRCRFLGAHSSLCLYEEVRMQGDKRPELCLLVDDYNDMNRGSILQALSYSHLSLSIRFRGALETEAGPAPQVYRLLSEMLLTDRSVIDEHTRYPRRSSDLTLLGALVARCLMEGQTLSSSLNPAFWKYMLAGELDDVHVLLNAVGDLDAQLAASMSTMLQVEAQCVDMPYAAVGAAAEPSTARKTATSENVRKYVVDVCRQTLSIDRESFIAGFNRIAPFHICSAILYAYSDWQVVIEGTSG